MIPESIEQPTATRRLATHRGTATQGLSTARSASLASSGRREVPLLPCFPGPVEVSCSNALHEEGATMWRVAIYARETPGHAGHRRLER